MTSDEDSRWLQTLMKDLVGFTIYEIGDPNEDGFFDIFIKNGDGEKYFLTPSCDPEGNGPGFLFIEGVKDVPTIASG